MSGETTVHPTTPASAEEARLPSRPDPQTAREVTHAAEDPQITVIVPITSPEVRPTELVLQVGEALEKDGWTCEFVFVLDGVFGGVERDLRALDSPWDLHVVKLQGGGLGESIALSAGVAKARGQFIINAPQYLQAEPEDVKEVARALEVGADCVSTWRHPRVDAWLNRVQSALFNKFLRVLMGIPFHDLNSGLRGYRRQVLEEVNVYGELYRFLPVLALRQGFRVEEVKVRHREEKGRTGFYGIGVYVRRMLDILAITFLTRFTLKPLRFFAYLGLFSMIVGFALCAEPLYAKLFRGEELQAEPIFVLGAILACFGVQFVGFGLLGEIVIFTQAPNLREYKVEDSMENVTAAVAGVATEGPPEHPVPTSAEARQEIKGADEVKAPVRVRAILPGEDSRWDAFVQRHPEGTFFHQSGWKKVVAEIFHHKAHDVVLERGRQWLGILPLFMTKSPFLGRNMVSVPYGVYGGILAEQPEHRQLLVGAARDLAQKEKAGYVEFRHLEDREVDLERSSLYVTFRKDLPATAEEVLPAIPRKARAEVRRGMNKFHLTFSELSDLNTFYDLFAENKQYLGSPPLPKRWFQALKDTFGNQVVMHQVKNNEGVAIAVTMSFCYKETVNAYYSGVRRGVNKTGVNDFIYCKLMEWSVDKGYSRFDFGRSRMDTGPAHFKKNMGFEPEPLHYDYLLVGPKAKLPEFHPSNPKLATPRKILMKMPKFLVRGAGGRLSKYLP